MKVPRYGAIFFITLSCSPIIYYHYYFYYVQQLRPQDETSEKLKFDKNEKFEKLREEILENFDKKNDRTIREFNLEKLDKEYNINWYASGKRPERNIWTKMSIRDSNSSIFESWFKNISLYIIYLQGIY